jgi:hypothetical protein
MNWHQIEKLERLRGRLKKLGYVMCQSKYSTSGDYLIGVYPLDDKLPLYSRDAELFTGTTESIESWIRGIEHRNDYLTMLKATSEDKIQILEEKYVKTRIHKGMLEKIKNPDKELDKHTQDFIDLHSK